MAQPKQARALVGTVDPDGRHVPALTTARARPEGARRDPCGEIACALQRPASSNRFPVDLIAIMNSAEETGRLPEMLIMVADEYEEKVDFAHKTTGQAFPARRRFRIVGGNGRFHRDRLPDGLTPSSRTSGRSNAVFNANFIKSAYILHLRGRPGSARILLVDQSGQSTRRICTRTADNQYPPKRLHPDRAAGGDRHHCRVDRTVASPPSRSAREAALMTLQCTSPQQLGYDHLGSRTTHARV